MWCSNELSQAYDLKKQQETNFNRASEKLTRKIKAIKMLIDDANVSESQKNKLRNQAVSQTQNILN